ncbi:MAG: type II toxin-antitoxin system VapC family toxin [Sphingobacteriaceae bacterium]|nr:MAG: type II toxin-antitoxin system VapC family toxin [Sphingobacteriaceae bacterium]
MERPQYLIDTNVIIDYLENKLSNSGLAVINEALDTKCSISIITKIELLVFNAPAEHYQLLKNFINDVEIIDLTSAVADRTIAIRKLYKIKLPDAIIAATALVHKFALVTRNITDFKRIKGLKIINPHL